MKFCHDEVRENLDTSYVQLIPHRCLKIVQKASRKREQENNLETPSLVSFEHFTSKHGERTPSIVFES